MKAVRLEILPKATIKSQCRPILILEREGTRNNETDVFSRLYLVTPQTNPTTKFTITSIGLIPLQVSRLTCPFELGLSRQDLSHICFEHHNT
jgi:hypothetical protein